MKIAIFSTKPYDRTFLESANQALKHELTFFKYHLEPQTCRLAEGFDAVCVFVNDHIDATVLRNLKQNGVQLVLLRCSGFNNVDITTAKEIGITVLRVPAYSPHGVAEHAIALMLTLNRRLYRSHSRVRENNFSLDGLMGFEMNGKTASVIGTGAIGRIVAKILLGFGCNVLAYDPFPSEELTKAGVTYTDLDTLFRISDIISLHTPLFKENYHLINQESIAEMKDGVMLINTSRGGLIDTQAVIDGLKTGKIGYLGLDVYEEEENLFFEDLSNRVNQDDTFSRLITFPNVIVTAHQAFFTNTAMKVITETTLQNATDFANGHPKKENRT